MMSFSVLLRRPEKWEREAVTKFLQYFLKIPFIDAAHRARGGWGFLGENMEEAEARRMVLSAGQSGLEVFPVSDDEIVVPPKTRLLRGGRFTPEGFHFFFGTEKDEKFLAWENLILAAAASFKIDTRTQKIEKIEPTMTRRAVGIASLAAGIPIGLGKTKTVEKTVMENELILIVDIHTADARLRVDARSFNFSVLGPKKQYNAMMNLKIFLKEIVGFSPAAWTNRGGRVLLSDRPMNDMGYDTEDDFDKETRWLLTLLRRA